MNSASSTGKKVDRRTAYTRMTVKDALLELLEEQPFEKITVAALCRQAEITRATFYLHFSDINAVLDELLDEALMVTEAAAADMKVEARMSAIMELVRSGSAEDLRPCHFSGPHPLSLCNSQNLHVGAGQHGAILGEILSSEPQRGGQAVYDDCVWTVLCEPLHEVDEGRQLVRDADDRKPFYVRGI